MSLYNNCDDFNNVLFSLVNQKIKEIKYFGLRLISEDDSEDFSKYTTKYKDVHSFETALVLQMESGDIYEITWDNSFYCYGIGIIKNNYKDLENYSIKKWIMTDDTFWKKYIDKKILFVSVLWDSNPKPITIFPTGEKIIEEIMAPVTCLIYFYDLNDRIIISTSGFIGEEEDKLFRGHDNIIVTNNVETAVKINLI